MTAIAPDVLYSVVAEEAFIGGLLNYPDRLSDFVHEVTAGDFYTPTCASVWLALLELHAQGQKVDDVTVMDALRRQGANVNGGDYVHLQCVGAAPAPEHVEILRTHRLARELLVFCGEAVDGLRSGKDPYDVAARLAEGTANTEPPAAGRPSNFVPVDELIKSAEDDAPWVIPGLLRTDWRAMVVASEGAGKSTLLRQIAICASQGVHPFTRKPIRPIVVAVVDLENPKRAIAETGQAILDQCRIDAPDRYAPGRCVFWSAPGGVDLRSRRGAAELERGLREIQPQLVVLGPLYKASVRRTGEHYEQEAEALQALFDDLRTRYGFALLIEHHAPQAEKGVRAIRPYGSSLWLRWSELGIGLEALDANAQNDLTLKRWRGDRVKADWPEKVRKYGRIYPFEDISAPDWGDA